MAIIHDTITIGPESGPVSIGNLTGGRVSSEVFGAIDSRGHASFFGSDFDHIRHDFFERHIKPMDNFNFEITRTVNMLLNPDRIRILNSVEDFRSIPTSMEIPILLFKPVRDCFEAGTIEGFGYDYDSLPEEDVFGRLIDNFTCDDVAAASDENGWYDITATLYSDDPELSDDELYAIKKTRDYILDKILNDSDRDPTAIDLSRG